MVRLIWIVSFSLFVLVSKMDCSSDVEAEADQDSIEMDIQIQLKMQWEADQTKKKLEKMLANQSRSELPESLDGSIVTEELYEYFQSIEAEDVNCWSDQYYKTRVRYADISGDGYADVLFCDACCFSYSGSSCIVGGHIVVNTGAQFIDVEHDQNGDSYSGFTYYEDRLVGTDLRFEPADAYCCPSWCDNTDLSWDSNNQLLVVGDKWTSRTKRNDCP